MKSQFTSGEIYVTVLSYGLKSTHSRNTEETIVSVMNVLSLLGGLGLFLFGMNGPLSSGNSAYIIRRYPKPVKREGRDAKKALFPQTGKKARSLP